MKSIEEQKADKARAISELIIEQAQCIVKALNTDLPEAERAKYALKAMIIKECHIPIVLAQPLQRKEYAKGGISEHGAEMIITK